MLHWLSHKLSFALYLSYAETTLYLEADDIPLLIESLRIKCWRLQHVCAEQAAEHAAIK